MQESASINSDYKRSLLDSLRLFTGVYPSDIQELLQRCDRQDLENGDTLLTPGASNEHVFVVLSGSLDVHVGSPDTPTVVEIEFERGDPVAIDGRKMGPAALLTKLNELGYSLKRVKKVVR